MRDTLETTARCFAECPEPINWIATAGVAVLAVLVLVAAWRRLRAEGTATRAVRTGARRGGLVF